MEFIGRDVLIKRFCGHCIDYGKCVEKCFDMEIIESIPPVDAVPVIRCKDCEHWECDDEESYCNELGIFNTDHNSYCSYAKRKEK